MEAGDAAELIAELSEERAEAAQEAKFRNRAAILIAALAAVLAIGGLGGGNATDDMIASNIKASDSWAFYQAKNVRQTMYEIAADDLQGRVGGDSAAAKRLAKYRATIARYDSEPDPKAPGDPTKGEGKKEIRARAQAFEAAFEEASARDSNFDLAEVALQLALVLGSVAILALSRWILGLSAAAGLVGALLTANGFLLLLPLP